MNGEPREVDDLTTVDDLVAELDRGRASAGVAVAVNGEVVRRGEWPHRRLGEDDRVEVLGAVQGG